MLLDFPGFPKGGAQSLSTLTLLARSNVLYLCEGDGVDRHFHILSPRCFPACSSPQQRDTRHFPLRFSVIMKRHHE